MDESVHMTKRYLDDPYLKNCTQELCFEKMINHTITHYFIHKKLQHPLTLLLIFSILVWLLATCSTETRPAEPAVKEEAVRQTSDQEQEAIFNLTTCS
jgi:hypothetical protein